LRDVTLQSNSDSYQDRTAFWDSRVNVRTPVTDCLRQTLCFRKELFQFGSIVDAVERWV